MIKALQSRSFPYLLKSSPGSKDCPRVMEGVTVHSEEAEATKAQERVYEERGFDHRQCPCGAKSKGMIE